MKNIKIIDRKRNIPINVKVNSSMSVKKNEAIDNKKCKVDKSTLGASKSSHNFYSLKNKLITNDEVRKIIDCDRQNKNYSAMNLRITSKELIRVNSSSIQPFPKLNDFYQDNPDYFWNKQLKRVETEKSILNRPKSERRFWDNNMSNFGKVIASFKFKFSQTYFQ